jgi:sugar O-acyltransferase (sialic acid O-acetyltransferase NeuD family)
MVTPNYILIGGGGHARVVVDCLQELGTPVLGLFDPKFSGQSLYDVLQMGEYDPQFEPEALALIAIGDNQIRKRLAPTINHTFGNVTHQSVVISKRVQLGSGNMILHGAIIQAQTVIGDHVIINTGARVDHDCLVSSYVHLAPGVILCGNVTVGEGALIGAGATVIPGKKIGAWSTVGAGAVVIADVPDYAVVVGTPGRIIKTNKP